MLFAQFSPNQPQIKCQSMIISMGFLALAAVTTHANVYYVSPNGNDNNPGTSAYPFLTIQRGLNAASQGTSSIPETVQVRPGTYETAPIYFYYDHVRLVFEHDVVIVSRSLADPAEPNDPTNPNSFAYPGATLMTLENRRNVFIEGEEIIEGSDLKHPVLRMRPEEYPYGQYRHTIKLVGCKDIRINSFDMQDSGGDGIYIGRSSTSDCSNIQLGNIRCLRNRRNGLSVVSVDGLVIEDCLFAETVGEGPQCGIDLEPNTSADRLANIVIRRCRFENNFVYGLLVSCRQLLAESAPVSITVERCYFTGNRGVGIVNIFVEGPTGHVTVQGSTIENAGTGIVLHKDASDGFQVVFDRCVIKDIYDPERWPIQINCYVTGGHEIIRPGGATFIDCQVIDTYPRYALKVSDPAQLFDVHGNLYVVNDHPSCPWPPYNITELPAENGVDIGFHPDYSPAIRVYNKRLWSWYSTITDAISASSDGDELSLTPTEFQENLNFTNKNVAVIGYDPTLTGNAKRSVLIGNENPNTVLFSLNDERARLEHLFIRKGTFGIRCVGGSPVVMNCDISECYEGIYCSHQSRMIVQETVIRNNSINGIKCHDSSARFMNNLIFGNVSNGFSVKNSAGATFRNNTISGGYYGIYGEGIDLPEIRNSIIWGTTGPAVAGTFSVKYCCLKDMTEGEGNIQADPLFAGPDQGNYFLRSSYGRWYPPIGLWVLDTVTSPCIDAGDPASPVGDELRPNGGRINMGAYGGMGIASKSGAPQIEGDINGDNCVDMEDLWILSNHWLESGNQ